MVCVWVCVCVFSCECSQVKAEAFTHVSQLQAVRYTRLLNFTRERSSAVTKWPQEYKQILQSNCQLISGNVISPVLRGSFMKKFSCPRTQHRKMHWCETRWDKALGSAGEVWDYKDVVFTWCYMFKTHYLSQHVLSPVNSVFDVSHVMSAARVSSKCIEIMTRNAWSLSPLSVLVDCGGSLIYCITWKMLNCRYFNQIILSGIYPKWLHVADQQFNSHYCSTAAWLTLLWSYLVNQGQG